MLQTFFQLFFWGKPATHLLVVRGDVRRYLRLWDDQVEHLDAVSGQAGDGDLHALLHDADDILKGGLK